MNISFVGHSHHRVTQSSRFFVDLLQQIGEVETVWDETWRGIEPVDTRRMAESADLIVVWQSVAYIKRLALLKHPNLVYVPMFDAARDLRRSFWQPLNGVKILNFSSTLHQRLQQFGCRSAAYFQYFPNPDNHRPTEDFSSLRGFFWQRQPRPAWKQIRKLLGSEFTSFHLHLATDPNTSEPATPDEVDRQRWRIAISHWFPERAELLQRLASANVYFAPRIHEGIGLSFLEAMAMGMAVCATDTPTHNEYIADHANGFLYSLDRPEPPDWSRAMEMGRRARMSVEQGHRRWVADRDRLIDFLTRPDAGPEVRHYARLAPVAVGAAKRPVRPESAPAAGVATAEGGRRLFAPERPSAEPTVTIATVVRNAPKELAITLPSVIAQTYRPREVLVIDGGSDPETLALLASHGEAIDYWRSAPDRGPYDAMNQAADLARGRWIIYINAGDTFADEDALARLLAGIPEDADFVAAHHVYLSPEGIEEIHRCVDFEKTYRQLLAGQTDGAWLSGIPGHQALLTRVGLIRKHRYDLGYRFAADHEFLYRMRRLGARVHIQPVIVSQYLGGGLSAQNRWGCLGEWRKIALAYTDHPERVERRFRRLLVDTLRYSRRLGPFAWRDEPIRSHPVWALLAEAEFRLRTLFDRCDALYARARTLFEQSGAR